MAIEPSSTNIIFAMFPLSSGHFLHLKILDLEYPSLQLPHTTPLYPSEHMPHGLALSPAIQA